VHRVALALTLALLCDQAVPIAAQGPHVSIRATTAAIAVTGGAATVSATLYDAGGTEIDGLVIEREPTRTRIVLAAIVKPGARIEARVPSVTDLRVEGSNGGPVTVRGVSGLLEVVNSNAAIVLRGVSGTVLASTSNGAIEGTVLSVAPGLPMSFLTSNGRVDVTLPAKVKAELRMESDTGPITTDFQLTPLGAEPLERRIMRGGRLRTIRHGAVNGGGPRIDVRTENAPIVIRSQE
jgi:hypothetical protein